MRASSVAHLNDAQAVARALVLRGIVEGERATPAIRTVAREILLYYDLAMAVPGARPSTCLIYAWDASRDLAVLLGERAA